MDCLRIEGGCKLNGRVKISGAKNAALPLMCASLLTAKPLVLGRVPDLSDVHTLNKVLEGLGVQVELVEDKLTLKADNITSYEAPYELVSKMRASVLVLGPLLARFGEAKVSLPGGCAIGARPIDVLLNGLKSLGATITLDEGYVLASAPNGLTGADLYLPKPAVTGTENLMMAAVLAKGKTRIFNAAREPEITALADCLIAMGANITGAGTSVIEVDGVKELNGANFDVIPDRIEAGTYLLAAAMCGEDVTIEGVEPKHNEALVGCLKAAGVKLDVGPNWYRVKESKKAYTPVDVTTEPYPGFATDLQAQIMVFLTQCHGQSLVKETIYENRFMHVLELKRMNASLTIEGQSCFVDGPAELKGAEVMASDLRCSASLVLAALMAKGTTTIRRIYHLDRGYEHLEDKLGKLGAKVTRLKGTADKKETNHAVKSA